LLLFSLDWQPENEDLSQALGVKVYSAEVKDGKPESYKVTVNYDNWPDECVDKTVSKPPVLLLICYRLNGYTSVIDVFLTACVGNYN